MFRPATSLCAGLIYLEQSWKLVNFAIYCERKKSHEDFRYYQIFNNWFYMGSCVRDAGRTHACSVDTI